jgi:AhpD family alkylhydroperoxidase
MTPSFPAGHIQLSELATKPHAAMFRLEAAIDFDPGLRELVRLRASQINGCAFCIDMHWKDARAAERARSGSTRSTSGARARSTASASGRLSPSATQ